ncbi:MAG: glycosyltransferase family 4 protein, partial [Bacteroidota bacterium]
HVRPSVETLRALYNGAAVLLHPSRSEGWGLVPMEAAACGAAVVSSANPGILEFLDEDDSVSCAPVGDGEALGARAVQLLSDPARRRRQAEAARAAVARFDLAQTSALFLDLLQTYA